MRLLNTRTLQLSEFFGDDIPKYAVLSHTWDRQELSFRDMDGYSNDDVAFTAVRGKIGFEKAKFACKQAESDDLDWIWIDTCCIDKTSSAELTEAINSMYAWYEQAEVCYAFLMDVPMEDGIGGAESAFRLSRWFTRAWTLQELIAPAKVVFFGQQWWPIGLIGPGMRGQGFAKLIEEITGVPLPCLLKWESPTSYSIAHRMYWAASRKCTRVEDVAYSLMGIFDVNMPLIYGEGKKAFVRLQEEIIKSVDDDSIFAWLVAAEDPRADTIGSVLAESPADFAQSANIVPLPKQNLSLSTMTKNGVQMTLEIGSVSFTHPSKKGMIFAAMNCAFDYSIGSQIGLWLLQPAPKVFGEDTYCRYISTSHKFARARNGPIGPAKTVFIRKKITELELQQYLHIGTLNIHNLETNDFNHPPMCPMDRKGYVIASVDSCTLPDWDSKYTFVRHVIATRVSLHGFRIESNVNGMLPLVFLCGIKRSGDFYEPEAAFCLLVLGDQEPDMYINAIAEQRIQPPWVATKANASTEGVTSSTVSVNGIDISVTLNMECPQMSTPVAGRKQIYRAYFKFGQSGRALIAGPQRQMLNEGISLDALERREILTRMIAYRTHQQQWDSLGAGAAAAARFSGNGALARIEYRYGPRKGGQLK